MTRRILRDLRIDKVAAVDRPCQEHASADIMKRADDDDSDYIALIKRTFTAEQRRHAASSGAAMPGGRYPIENVEDLHNAIHAIGRGSGSHAAIRAHIISRARALGATDQLPDDWKKVAPTESQMLKELAKALGLPETATEADITKALTDNMAKAAASAEALAKAQTELTAVKADLAKAKKPNMDSDNDGDEDCGPDGVTKGLAFQTIDGAFVSKKMAGAMYETLKAQDARLRKNAEDIAKRDETDAVTSFAKRATDVGFGAEFGPTLRKAYGGDAAAQAEVEKRIKGLQKQVEDGGLFTIFGKSSPAEGSAEEELMAKVAEVQKANPKLKPAQAYSKAYTDPANADIVKRMKAEANA